MTISRIDVFLQKLLYMDFAWYDYVWLPLLIFLARIADQSVGTLRLIFVSKGYKVLAPILGFFEVVIWILAVGQIISDLTNFVAIFAYGAGFAVGNYIGIKLDERLQLGNVIIRVIPSNDTSELIERLSELNFGFTAVDGQGSRGPVKLIFSSIKRKEVKAFIDTVNQYNPNAFYTIEDVKMVNEGIHRQRDNSLRILGMGFRKSK